MQKKSKRMPLLAAVAVLVIAVVVVLFAGRVKTKEGPFKLVLATDIHYLSPELTDRGYYFEQLNLQGDGRLLWYQQEILEVFLAELREMKPDAVLLSGDLSYNGEKLSHEDLAVLLSGLEEAGVPVYVIPGNHDINNLMSRSFFGEEAERVDTVQIKDFQKIYRSFGYGRSPWGSADRVIDRSPDGLSYRVQLYDKLSIYMLNTNKYLDGYQIGCGVNEETLAWWKECLTKDQESGRIPMAVGHHNLLMHSRLFTQGYQMTNYPEVQQVMADGRVPLYLGGHMHIWHEAKETVTATDGSPVELWDVATSSLVVNPHQYGVITVEQNGSIHYEKQSIRMEEYAASTGRTEEDLIHFTEYAEKFYYQNQYDLVMMYLNETDLDEATKEKMADYAARLNVAYFAGMTEEDRNDLQTDECYEIWQEAVTKWDEIAFWGEYMKEAMK